MEIKLGMDTVEFSDSSINTFFPTKMKNFLNFYMTRYLRDVRTYYSADENFPIMIWHFGIYEPATRYERYQY